jgi:hypothetical protein
VSAPRIAWAIFAMSLLAMAAALVVWAATANEPLTPDTIVYPFAYLAFGVVGALVVSRQPSNAIGRLGLLAGVIGAVAALADSLARSTQPFPGQDWAAWLATWGFPVSLTPPLLIVLLFPTGRLASPRWRIVGALIVVGAALVGVGTAFSPEFADHPDNRNPLGVEALRNSILDEGGLGWLLLIAGAIAAAAGLVPRLRRATGVERQQLKWITYAAALQGLAWVVLALDPPGVAGELAQAGIFVTLLLIPVATGIAILRYRLYEIDLVVRRTLVYGAVVAILGVTYVGLVVGSQAVLSRVTGDDLLPVALSTLAIAALFGPVRARVRDVVDRRFYRSRYDAQRTLEAFGARLRDEVELDQVARALVGTATRAVRPASAGVWLRGRTR